MKQQKIQKSLPKNPVASTAALFADAVDAGCGAASMGCKMAGPKESDKEKAVEEAKSGLTGTEDPDKPDPVGRLEEHGFDPDCIGEKICRVQ